MEYARGGLCDGRAANSDNALFQHRAASRAAAPRRQHRLAALEGAVPDPASLSDKHGHGVPVLFDVDPAYDGGDRGTDLVPRGRVRGAAGGLPDELRYVVADLFEQPAETGQGRLL